MAYTTGAATSLADVYDALATFMTSNGWSLLDTVSGTTRDQVFYSSGIAGNLSMTYRLTANNETTNPWKNPGCYQKAVPQIIARGYHNWDAGTDAGTNEYGMLDMMLLGPTTGGGSTWYYNRVNTTVPLTSGTTPIATPLAGNTAVGIIYDGRRRLVGGRFNGTNTGYMIDAASPAGQNATWTMIGSSNHSQRALWVWEAATNKEYIYYLNTTSTLANQWFKYDIATGANIQLAAPIWAASNSNGSELLWDGNDTIYAFLGNGTAHFDKYIISTNTWVDLTNLAVTVPTFSTNRCTRTAYVPGSVLGAFSSNSDAILFKENTGSTIRMYNINSNTWSSPITSPIATSEQTHILWDNQRYLYIWNAAATPGSQMYRSDLTTAPNSFTNMGTVDNVSKIIQTAVTTNTPSASLRCSNTLVSRYWFVGDADSVVAVVGIENTKTDTKYYWFRLGRYTTNYRSQIMTLTGSAGAGVRSTVSVDSTSGYVAGDTVTFFNPANGTTELAVIYDILSATQFRVNNLVNSYATGSKVGIDVVQHILTGDSGFGTTALLSSGFKPDFLRPWYYVSPDPDTITRNITYSGRGAYLPLDFQIRNPFMTTAGTYPTTGSLPFANCEFLGRITNVYALPTQTYPGLQAENVLPINGQNYIFFPQAETAWLASPNNIGILVGPIS